MADLSKVKIGVRKPTTMNKDRESLSDAKDKAALKSMSDRFDNPKGKNAGLSLSQAFGRRIKELDLFDESTKLMKDARKFRVAGKQLEKNKTALSGASRSIKGKVVPKLACGGVTKMAKGGVVKKAAKSNCGPMTMMAKGGMTKKKGKC